MSIFKFQVVIQYFEPSVTTCLIVPWLREVGFAILYGALVLKIYRFVKHFQCLKDEFTWSVGVGAIRNA